MIAVIVVAVVSLVCDAKAFVDDADDASPRIDITFSKGALRGWNDIVGGFVWHSWVNLQSCTLQAHWTCNIRYQSRLFWDCWSSIARVILIQVVVVLG